MSRSFEFRFIAVLARHADNQDDNVEVESDLKALNDLGKEGWQVTGISPDPQHPNARLLVSLQRETAG
jgi:hypothetical protein